MVRRSWSGSAAAALVGVLALGGCTGESKAEDSSTTYSTPRVPSSSSTSEAGTGSGSSTSSSSGSPSSTTSTGADGAGELPEEARENTKEGAAAFGKHYQLEIGRGAMEADTSRLERLGAPDCPPCEAVIDNITADKKKGYRIDRQPYRVSQPAATKRPDEGYKVTMHVSAPEHFRLDKSGSRNATVKSATFNVTQHVAWQDGSWRVLDWVVS